jgi:hypothetical protein
MSDVGFIIIFTMTINIFNPIIDFITDSLLNKII